MRLLSRLLVVLITCLIAMALLAMPVQAQCEGPIIELSPSSGAPETEVIITGQNFYAGKYVDIYYDGTRIATNKTNSSGGFKIFFTIPEGCKGEHQVQAVVVHDIADTHFTVKPGLTVSPEKGPVGTNVTVKGKGFAKNEQGIELIYDFNGGYKSVGRNITANAKGSWEISFPIPPSTAGEYKIDAEGAESKLYDVNDATFEITPNITIDKSWGRAGEIITMTGSTFMAYEKGIQILFAGQAVVLDIKADAQGYWEVGFEVPEVPAGTYSVIAYGAWTPKEDILALSFEIKPDIVLSPSEGHVGINLTVTGHGFAANEDVTVMYDGKQEKITETNNNGSFIIDFTVPESQHGEHLITVGYSVESQATAIFTMESTPPDKSKLVSPANGGWAGLVGKVMPTFEWSDVLDESGVRYRLQVATSANDTATGEFVQPIFSVSDLIETSYTLNETEALPYGTYYWIVQAIDKAGNAGNWTKAYSFRAGLLPLWGFITTIVAIVVLISALVRYLVRRRIYYYE